MNVVDLGQNVWLIDLYDQGTPYRTGAYLIKGPSPVLIDTGSGRTLDHLIDGLKACGLEPSDLRYIIPTHVHLDHAGGAGHLMERAPAAQLIVHPRGARHMVDPTRLWQGATAVYGHETASMFGSVVPIEQGRVVIKQHLETLTLEDRTLTFFDSPGHANHHFTLLDPKSDALFAGDALGIRYVKAFTGLDFDWVMPSTSPIDFNPERLRQTVNMLKAVPFSKVYHGHFGVSGKEEACREVVRYGDKMAEWIKHVYQPEIDVNRLTEELARWTVEQLRLDGHPCDACPEALRLDLFLNSLGLKVYLERANREVTG